jgi:uncharacterized membrane protein YcaP (DUF421 family)
MPAALTHDLFHLSLPVAEKILRPVLVYVFLVICLRIFGKRELAQLSPFDIVVLMLLSNTVQNAIIGEDNTLIGGLIGALSLLILNWLVIRFLFRHRRLDQLIEGKPCTLIAHGRVSDKALARELMSRGELETMAHRQGVRNISEIETCVLEPGGTVLIERKEPPIEDRRHAEILARIDQLSREIQELKESA